MITVKIIRTFPTAKQVVGKLFVQNEYNLELYSCYTLELPYLDNQREISCIPAGEYTIEKRFSEKYKEHWQVLNVKDRDMILIHFGNFYTDTKGCILIGKNLSDIDNDGYKDVTNSRLAMEELNNILTDTHYKLIIK